MAAFIAVQALGVVPGGSAADKATLAYLAFSDGYWQVWAMAVDGGGARQITRSEGDKTRVSWFPDGKHLLVSSLEGTVLRVEIDSGAELALSLPLSGMSDAVVSPDGERIAFSLSTADARDDNEIWLVGTNGGGLEKLTSMAWLQHEPVFDPMQPQLYFLSGDGGQSHDIWSLSLENGSREQVTAGSLYHFDVAPSGDGRIAFSSNRAGNYEIYILDRRDGDADATRVTTHASLDAGPAWSPDARSIVFHSLRSGTLNLWRKDLASGALEQLTDHPKGARGAAWFHGSEASP